MPDHPWKDKYTLLCERCGYVVEGIDPDLPCPECGQMVRDSHPRKRVGSPWQDHRSLLSLIRTWGMLIRRPRRCWDSMEIRNASGLSLMGWGLSIGLFLPVATMFAIALISSIKAEEVMIIGVALFYIAILGGGFLVIALLYAAFGVTRMKFWANQRGYRITSPIAWTILGHASFGLALIPMITFCGMCLMLIAALSEMVLYEIFPDLYRLQIALVVSGYFMILGSIPAGLIVFEILSSFGFRRMRYRNVSSPSSRTRDDT